MKKKTTEYSCDECFKLLSRDGEPMNGIERHFHVQPFRASMASYGVVPQWALLNKKTTLELQFCSEDCWIAYCRRLYLQVMTTSITEKF